MKQFRSQIVNLEKLYNHSFRIPDYQRLYSWGKDEIENLWRDLYTAFRSYQSSKNGYFMGTMIVCRRTNHERLNLIDGQQRTTALSILLHVIRKEYLRRKAVLVPNITVQREIRETYKKYIQLPKTYDAYRNVKYAKNLSSSRSNNPDIITARDLRSDNVEYKYKFAISFFLKAFEEAGLTEPCDVSDFYHFLLKNIFFNLVESPDESASIRIFQTLNTRGQSLSDSAIFKSYILGKCQGDKSINRQKNDFNKFWHDHIENFLNESPNFSEQLHFNANDCVHCYTYYKLRAVPRKNMAAALHKVLDDENPPVTTTIKEFKTFFKRFEELISDPNFQNIIIPLFYLPWQLYLVTILALIGQNYKQHLYTTDDVKHILFQVRQYYYIHLINNHTAHSIRTASINLIRNLANNEPPETIINSLSTNHLAIQEADNTLQGAVYIRDEAPKKFIKPILLWLEYENSHQFYVSNSTIDIDHIFPKSKASLAESTNFCLGNLAILEDSLNKSIQDEQDFNKKASIILNGTTIRGEHIPPCKFKTTRAIYEPLDRRWDADAIEHRKQAMIDEIRHLLGYVL